MKALEESTIIVCGIVRNAEKGLRRNIPVIDKLCQLAKNYHIFIYENDSTDNTKSLLREWQLKDNAKIFIKTENTCNVQVIPSSREVTANPFFSKHRIEKMATLRNHYMNYIDDQKWTADYLVVVDMDVAQLELSGILSSFVTGMEWDAVIANGYSLSPKLTRRYHDSYALIAWGDQFDPQTEDKIKDVAGKLGSLTKTDDWIRIYSGFGGLAIYRFEAVKGLRYSVIPNDDTRVEVRCEHVSIYEGMLKRGYNRFFINPAMILKYQDVTLSIIYKSIKRLLFRIVQRFCN